jgi:hypothetical protein
VYLPLGSIGRIAIEYTCIVNLTYIIMPRLMAINITKFVPLQFGGQVAYLLNAKSDTAKVNDWPRHASANSKDRCK